MPLFQKSVLNNFLKQQDKDSVVKAYKKFSKHFHDPKIQAIIRSSKEEQYQGEFLIDLFVNVFGYIKRPNSNFNLDTELKNEKSSNKADGAILKDGFAIGVIELKGTNTKDLEKVRRQAFDYKANQTGCVYVVTSNFEKLRFYIKTAVEYEEFNLFTLTEQQFELLYLCLASKNLLNNVPLKISEASIQEEKKITHFFYKDYSLFKRELYRDLVKKNVRNEIFLKTHKSEEATDNANKNIKLNLFKKSQKLIDRFLFIFFAEDRDLLPVNSTKQILNKWKKDQDFGDDRPLYDLFKQYFNYLDTGRQGTSERAEIFAYNGGLFKPDLVLDSLIIDSQLLLKHIDILQEYDFVSQVDVNILGHIFENSLNEIESVNAEIEGVEFDKQKTKRKKDGVFYTPKYITKYIVDNTVGSLLIDKRKELAIDTIDFSKNYILKAPRVIEVEEKIKTNIGEISTIKKNKTTLSVEGEEFLKRINQYREFILSLTICDPACGSGAFLNQALNFLIEEHVKIDEMQSSIQGISFVFPDIENHILERNIYGVDLNEESVEIAKLSLWLRTAQPRRKLNNLNSNIKCGDSLIDSKVVAGDKAFNWEKEFSEVFAKGGFDVIIGNPPYVQSHAINESTKEFIYRSYKTAEYQINTYAIFIEKIFALSKDGGAISIIIPNYWLSTKFDSILRRKIFLENHCTELVNVFMVFEDATVDTLILTAVKTSNMTFPKETNLLSITPKLSTIEQRLNQLDNRNWYSNRKVVFYKETDDTLLSFEEKLNLSGVKTLGDYFIFKKGMQPYEMGKGTPTQSREMMNEKIYHSEHKTDETYKPLLKARNVKRYFQNGASGYIKYGKNLAAPRDPKIFRGPRILINRILSRRTIDGIYLEEELINDKDIFNLMPIDKEVNVKALSAFVLSPICATFFRKENINLNRAAFPKINVNTLEKFPIPDLTPQIEHELESLVDHITKHINLFQNRIQTFLNYLHSQFNIVSFSNKIESWNNLDFGDFIKELNVTIKKSGGAVLTKSQEMEWMELFDTKKKEVLELKKEIEQTDKDIDRMLYNLYRLSEDEIAIVKGE